MSSIAIAPSTVCAIRIVSLPLEMQTTYDVSDFLANALGNITITTVNIIAMNTSEGVPYRSAFIDIDTWGDSECANTFASRLMSSDSGLVISESEGFVSGGFMDNGFPNGIHYDNGKIMKYLKIVPSKRSHPSTTPLALSENAWTSIYIPAVQTGLSYDNGDIRLNDEKSFVEFFGDHLKIGKVSRVDFIVKTIPGTQREACSAYVHFDQWFDNTTTAAIRGRIDANGEYRCYGYYDGFEFKNFDGGRFMTLKINHKPIPVADETLNVHQLAASKTALESRNAELQETINRLEKELNVVKEAFKNLSGKDVDFSTCF
jgi:hypothetical protein